MSNYRDLFEYISDSNIVKGGKYTVSFNPPLSDTVSIITICRNAQNSIKETIECVKKLDYPNIEYIIVDGSSSDNTIDIIKKYDDFISFWISEYDKGPADAVNKGLAMAQGDYIFILAADDTISPDFFTIGVNSLKKSAKSFVFGDLELIDENSDRLPVIQKADKNYKDKIKYTMPRINQPTIIFTKEFFQQVGFQDISYKVAPDYDWLLRGHLKGLDGEYVEGLITKFSINGNSNVHFFKGIKDVKDSSFKYGGSIFWTNFYYYARYIKRYIKQLFNK